TLRCATIPPCIGGAMTERLQARLGVNEGFEPGAGARTRLRKRGKRTGGWREDPAEEESKANRGLARGPG
ncbi:MAG: hypothetical protein ACK6CE_10365, partial [Planctomycetota bacterium]